jgi:hypothetical protein
MLRISVARSLISWAGSIQRSAFVDEILATLRDSRSCSIRSAAKTAHRKPAEVLKADAELLAVMTVLDECAEDSSSRPGGELAPLFTEGMTKALWTRQTLTHKSPHA